MSGIPNEASPKRHRFIILEDEPLLADLYEMCIRDWFRDSEILKFGNGDDAFRMLAAQAPDMLIMDWTHPGMNGHELLQQIAVRRASYAILLTSGLFSSEIQPAISHDLKVGYLPKPFGVQQFWRALNEFIGPSDFPEKQALINR